VTFAVLTVGVILHTTSTQSRRRGLIGARRERFDV
jgi:hypothetical protein